MSSKFKLIRLGLIIALQLALNPQVSAINVKNTTDSTISVIVHLHNKTVGKEIILPGKVLDVNGDIRKLEVFKLSPSGVSISRKPFVCEGVFGSTIDIMVKKGDKSILECK